MPAVERPLDNRNRITIPIDFTKNWSGNVVIHPNYCATVIRPKNVPLEEAIKSVKILVQDMEHQLDMEKKGK